MTLDLTIDELLTTTRTVRKRLDCDRPVERSVIEECVEIAMQAPSGANSQGWQWVFVEEPELKERLAVIYRKQFDVTYRVMPINTYDDPAVQAQAVRRRWSATWLADNFERVPLIMVPCSPGRIDGASLGAQAGFWGSFLPAVWSFMLALRSRGLGTCITTVHLFREQEAAAMLGIPDGYAQACLLPVAYYTGESFRPAARRPVEELTYWNRWDER